MSAKKKSVTPKKRANEIKKRYQTTTAAQSSFGPLFNTEICWDGVHYHDCSEGFVVTDVEKLIVLACELELDQCEGFEGDYEFNCAPLHAMNALLLLISSNHSITDTVAGRLAHRCAETIPSIHDSDFVTEILGHNMVMLLCECGPVAIPYLVIEMRRLLLTPNLSGDSWLGASYVANAMRSIILECYQDIPLAISLADQYCAPLLEFSKHPTATRNRVNRENASSFTSKLLDIAVLITDEQEVLELYRNNKGFYGNWIDVLRSFSLEPHPQDEMLRERGNRMDWVIRTWNENHPEKQYPFPRGVKYGPFPGQPGYELPKRLFRHKYCRGSYKCRYEPTSATVAVQVCERCEHTYYCNDDCQRNDWCGQNGHGHRSQLELFPPKFRIHPLKRLTKYYRTDSHRRQCLLIQSYKQWVERQKEERNGGATEDDEREQRDVKGKGGAAAEVKEPSIKSSGGNGQSLSPTGQSFAAAAGWLLDELNKKEKK